MRIAKLTDYAIVLLATISRHAERLASAAELADETKLPAPTVAKLLKTLSRAGLVASQRGVKGGYRLARAARDISVAQVIAALEGPVGLTECSDGAPGCARAAACPVTHHWHRINVAVREALERLTLAEMSTSAPTAPCRGDGPHTQAPFLVALVAKRGG